MIWGKLCIYWRFGFQLLSALVIQWDSSHYYQLKIVPKYYHGYLCAVLVVFSVLELWYVLDYWLSWPMVNSVNTGITLASQVTGPELGCRGFQIIIMALNELMQHVVQAPVTLSDLLYSFKTKKLLITLFAENSATITVFINKGWNKNCVFALVILGMKWYFQRIFTIICCLSWEEPTKHLSTVSSGSTNGQGS